MPEGVRHVEEDVNAILSYLIDSVMAWPRLDVLDLLDRGWSGEVFMVSTLAIRSAFVSSIATTKSQVKA